jgi:hypothetical protein
VTVQPDHDTTDSAGREDHASRNAPADPRKTDHPAGDDQAGKNAENEPAG